jgi:phosphatidate cytidylyltransferase
MVDANTGPGAGQAAPLSKGAVFLRRLASSLVLWAVVIAALFSPNRVFSGFCFLTLMSLLAGVGLAEFYGLVEKRGLACFKRWGIWGGALLMGSTFVYLSGWVRPQTLPAKANDFETGFLVLFVLGLGVRQLVSERNLQGLTAISTTLFGLMYVPWLLNFVQKINFFPRADGRFYLIYFIVVTKFSDMGAYVTGSIIGRHKLIPRVSPGKTWEGFGGALLFSTGASLAFNALAPARLTGMTWCHAVVLGLLLGAAAAVGDLIESLFKREAGVKDSGRFFPGIGGILDLLDSILFNAPLMYLYLRHILTD